VLSNHLMWLTSLSIVVLLTFQNLSQLRVVFVQRAWTVFNNRVVLKYNQTLQTHRVIAVSISPWPEIITIGILAWFYTNFDVAQNQIVIVVLYFSRPANHLRLLQPDKYRFLQRVFCELFELQLRLLWLVFWHFFFLFSSKAQNFSF
jgi:hypothetical protein